MESFHQPNTKEIFEPSTLNKLVGKTRETHGKNSLSMQPFIDLYGIDTVKKDYSLIAERLLGYFDHKLSGPEKMGHIFESAFLDVGNQGRWFGENSELIQASKYDDIVNGVDMIASLVDEDDSARHLAIASDLTFSFPGVSAKFNKITNNVRRGQMAQVKYFNSDLLHITGQLRNIPRTVIGLDVNNLNNFLLNWLKEPELAQLQYGGLMLNQISTQSRAFAKVAGKQTQISDAYRKSADSIDKLLAKDYKGIQIPEDSLTGAISQHSQRLINEYS